MTSYANTPLRLLKISSFQKAPHLFSKTGQNFFKSQKNRRISVIIFHFIDYNVIKRILSYLTNLKLIIAIFLLPSNIFI